jgi:hypothetical protein
MLETLSGKRIIYRFSILVDRCVFPQPYQRPLVDEVWLEKVVQYFSQRSGGSFKSGVETVQNCPVRVDKYV